MDKVDKVNILGVNITNISQIELLRKIQDFLQEQKQYFIVTPNPEIILAAVERDEELGYILNHADLALADGIALKFSGWFYGKNLKRVTGADLTLDILKLAEEKKYRVAVFSWSRGLSNAAEIKSALAKKFSDSTVYIQAIERGEAVDFTSVNQFAPDIVFCALGAPYQEKFIYYNLAKVPSARIGVGVGGSFDFLTGKLQRAPGWLRRIGLEWLWRLIQQPKRIKRIFRATIVFPWKFFIFFFILPLFYRANVACLLFKRDNNVYKILITERVKEIGHWQLPQGGTNSEDLWTAGGRELNEEINTNNFKALAVFSNLYKYKFTNRPSEYGELRKSQRGYKGQKQSLFIAEFTGLDNDIKINRHEHRDWRWVEVDKFLQAISPIRREAGKIYLEKFKEIMNPMKL